MIGQRRWMGAAVVVLLTLAIAIPAQADDDDAIHEESRTVVLGQFLGLSDDILMTALAALRQRDDPGVAASLILALRFNRPATQPIADALAAITGETDARSWFDWMLWQEAHPEIVPHPSFRRLKLDLLLAIDPNFARFLPLTPAAEIRLEEVVWGGVAAAEGIPALTNPALVAAGDAGYLIPGEPVFGVEIDGDARAYPLRILDWHEMLNDVVGGVPVSLAYCTLCGSGILYDGRVEGREQPLTFGSSGLLYRSNKLMHDLATDSLWNQFTGRPVSGPLAGSGITLKILPIVLTNWRDWLAAHPDTRVLSLDTGYVRDYTPDAPYGHYFNSPDLMFPALAPDATHALKDRVFGIRTAGGAKAWPLEDFRNRPVINDSIGFTDVVLIGNAVTGTVRAYRRDGLTFAPSPAPDRLTADGEEWRVTENALLGPGDARLARMAGHVAFWFAWSAFVDHPSGASR
ncbi:MAG: DUF3179 domain-containing protein [Rhodospirillales bacterium]|nr:DUF3179 domain-containing protein [Rhodospirillales bacterium]